MIKELQNPTDISVKFLLALIFYAILTGFVKVPDEVGLVMLIILFSGFIIFGVWGGIKEFRKEKENRNKNYISMFYLSLAGSSIIFSLMISILGIVSRFLLGLSIILPIVFVVMAFIESIKGNSKDVSPEKKSIVGLIISWILMIFAILFLIILAIFAVSPPMFN